LAGGIAHDFNNLLTAILGYSEIMLSLTKEGDQFYKPVTIIQNAAEKGAELAKKILTITRKEKMETRPVDINEVVKNSMELLQRSIPMSIEIVTNLREDLPKIKADPSQMQQVIMNLCVNARDAMPHGGIIQVKAQNRILDEQYSRMNLEAKPGSYVEVSITDAGMGMPPEILERIFEPFFTTKAIGKGTGLGLSTAYAIVKSHGGFINVYSEVGKGTTFRVYIPAQTEGKVPTLGEKHDHPLGRGELILVVDDEAAIREITRATLEAYGYSVVTAIDGTEAIAIYVEQKDSIALVLTDMMMPFLDGTATVRALQKINPQVKILVVSGLTQNAPSSTFSGEKTVRFLHKPFTSETLLTELRLLLESSDEPMGRH
ncbi:MAG TPA: hybrid sensor histidine kinase/response regulator, partial [Bacteroidetes bacterium]|nr:hybrid sensor histidine kinase/response regulator [Bacteroidota bacterium]